MDNGSSSYDRFRQGDESAFAEIVREYSDGLLYFIHGLIANRSVAEELMEDVFVDLIVYPKRFKGKSSFKTFLYTIARNKAVDYIRKHKKECKLSCEEYDNILNEQFIPADAESRVIKSEERQFIENALGKIKHEYKAVLILFYFEEKIGRAHV